MFGVVVAVSFRRREREVELVAFMQVDERVLECLQGDAHAADEVEGLAFGCFFQQFVLAVGHVIQLV